MPRSDVPVTAPRRANALALFTLLAALPVFGQPTPLAVLGSDGPPSAAPPVGVKSVKAKKAPNGVELLVAMATPPAWSASVKPDGTILVVLDNAATKKALRTLTPKSDVVDSVATRQLNEGGTSLVQIEIRSTGPLVHSVEPVAKGLSILLQRLPQPELALAGLPGTTAAEAGNEITMPPNSDFAPGGIEAPAPTVAGGGSAAGVALGVAPAEDLVPTVTFEYSPPVSPYRIGSGDELSLDVFGISELKREVAVGPDGRIALPILGRLAVEGMTLEEAEAAIARVLRERSLATNPEVFVGVSNYQSQGVFVQGAVSQPGIVQIPGGKRVMELLSEVGGLSQRDPAGQRIFILRTGEDGEARKMVIDASKLLAQGDFSLNVLVLPGDLFMVPEPSKIQVFVSGAVQNPGPVELDNGAGLTVLQAITSAGGPTPRAKLQNVSIIRRNADGSQETIDVNVKKIRNGSVPDVALQNGDSVVVKEWFF